MRKELLVVPGLNVRPPTAFSLARASRWGAGWPSSTCRGVDLAVLETQGPFLSSARMTSCLCSPSLFPLLEPISPHTTGFSRRLWVGGVPGLAGSLVLKVKLMFQSPE